MGKQYYCDYCQRQFQDHLAARKKHLSSQTHNLNYQLWYKQFKDKKQLLESCIKKFPCHKYFTTGRCSFGDLCKYRHINDQEIIELKKEIG